MHRTAWAAFAAPDIVRRRCGGRRRWNAVRKARMLERRKDVAKLLLRLGHRPGVQSEMARRLNVHRSTICRDLKAILWGKR